MPSPTYVEPSSAVSYFTPAQYPAPGTARPGQLDYDGLPKLFRPLILRGLTFPNRIFLSPLNQYSSDDGHMTDYHIAHLGGIAQRGPGLLMTENLAVSPEGRVSPQDGGIWKDSQIAPLKRVVDFVHSQSGIIGVQLTHAGRKASTTPGWVGGKAASKEEGGWPDDILAPSALTYPGLHAPREMTKDDIEACKEAFAASVKRLVAAGVDFIELHGAHGFLLTQFMDPHTNKRTDEYGGSFENRIRLPLEIISITRSIIPDTMPLFFRISGTDFLEHLPPHWGVDDTVKFARILAEKGEVDLLDVSAGGVSGEARPPPIVPGYQKPAAIAVKKAVGDRLMVTAVGRVLNGKIANDLLEADGLDAVFCGRGFQKNPALVWQFAEELGGIEIKVAHQISWGFGGRGAGPNQFLRTEARQVSNETPAIWKAAAQIVGF